MAEVYVKVEVQKIVTLDVYIKCDESLISKRKWHGSSDRVVLMLTPKLKELAEQEAKDLDDMDWSDDGEIGVSGIIKAVEEKEANDYGFLDATKEPFIPATTQPSPTTTADQ